MPPPTAPPPVSTCSSIPTDASILPGGSGASWRPFCARHAPAADDLIFGNGRICQGETSAAVQINAPSISVASAPLVHGGSERRSIAASDDVPRDDGVLDNQRVCGRDPASIAFPGAAGLWLALPATKFPVTLEFRIVRMPLERSTPPPRVRALAILEMTWLLLIMQSSM